MSRRQTAASAVGSVAAKRPVRVRSKQRRVTLRTRVDWAGIGEDSESQRSGGAHDSGEHKGR